MPNTGYCNIPGQRRGYSSDGSSTRAISDNSSGNDSQEDSDKQIKDSAESPECQNEADITLMDSDEGMDTIKRVIKPREPVRPPRIIDGKQPLPPPSSSIEYYNLCHPPPVQEETGFNPAPTIPRRKPYISNSDFDKKVQMAQNNQEIREPQHVSCSHTNSQRAPSTTSNWSERTCQPRSRCTSRSSTGENSTAGRNMKKKYLNRRRKGSTCHCKHTGATENKDSVILMYSRYCNGSIEWAKYLHKLFTELSRHKGKLTVKHLPVEDMTCLLPAKLESEIYNARLQLVIVSPLFLQWVYKNPNHLVGRLLQQDRVIALLLGVREEQVLAEHRSSLISFPQWVHLEARDHDLEFVQTVLYFSTQILHRTEARIPLTAESLFFTLFPRKVTENQNKVVIMFDKPLNARSTLRVVVEKTNGQKMAVDDVKLKNPYTLMVTFPVCLFAKSCLVNLYLEIDGESKGFRQLKCESKTHELDSLLATLCDPMEFLCQTLSISPYCKDQLDETLTNNLMSNIPKHGFPLLSFPPEREECEFQSKEHCEFPTLLHFSSAHGLEQLTCALLDCPGAKQAVSIRNVHDLSPSDVAKENGFFDLAEILKAHQHNPSRFSHIYDYIKHGRLEAPKDMSTIRSNLTFFHAERPVSNISEISDYSGPDPYKADRDSAYKVPPPPRPIPSTPTKQQSAYLDMSGSNSGTPSPCQQRRYTNERFQDRDLRNQPKDLNDLFQNLHTRKINNQPLVTNPQFVQDNRARASTMSKYNLDSSYQEIRDPQARHDPFGTMRASKARRSLKEKTLPAAFGNENGKERLYVNDPFGTLRASRANSVPKSLSSEASNDDVFSPPVETQSKTNRTDYRGIPNDESSDNLAVTEELLELLEDFKHKSYTVKEMEIMFENWRRKASLPENSKAEPTKKSSKSDLLKASKSAYSLLKLFRGHTSDSNPKIKRTSSTKKFLKPSGTEFSTNLQVSDSSEHKTFHPPLDESQLSVVALPPTPLKPENSEEVSSQILPLHRLSGSSLPNTSRISNTSLQLTSQIRQKPIAEVSPFSNFKNDEVPTNSPQLDETYRGDRDMPFVPNNSMMDASTTTIPTSNTPNNTLINTTTRTIPSTMQQSQGSRIKRSESGKETSPSGSTTDRDSTPQTTEQMPVIVQRQTVSQNLMTDSKAIYLRRQTSSEDQNKSPVKDKFQKMRRSITEPLMQYFHEMHMTSPELEEPDILNTPKSVIPTSEENGHRLSRKLFGPRELPKRHSARTSQVNEYQNISPTPSTDL